MRSLVRRLRLVPGGTTVTLLVGAILLLSGPVLVGACANGSASPSPSASPSGDAVVARVDGVPILQHEVAETVAASRLTGTALTRRQALDAMVRRRLVEADARRLGVAVPAAEVQARYDQVAQSVGGAQTLAGDLAEAGLTAAAYRAQLAGALLAERLAAREFARVKATPAQAGSYYRSHRAQLTVPAAVDLGDIAVKTQRIAQEVEKRLRQGYPFTATASQLSDDPESKASGGRLGWVRLSSLPPGLARALRGVAVGGLTRPAQAIGGWHVLKLYGRRAAHTYAFSKVRAAIVSELTREARDAALARRLSAARAHAKVVTLP